MKAFKVEWTNGVDIKTEHERDKYEWGDVTVVADSLTKAIARFQKEYHPGRVIESVRVGSDDALVDGLDK